MPNHNATVAVITGGTQGLGRAIAETLLAEGCKRLVLVGQDREKGARVVCDMKDMADVIFLSADLADLDQARSALDAALTRFGRVTALVNAAAKTAHGSILDTSAGTWDQIHNINARAPLFSAATFCTGRDCGGLFGLGGQYMRYGGPLRSRFSGPLRGQQGGAGQYHPQRGGGAWRASYPRQRGQLRLDGHRYGCQAAAWATCATNACCGTCVLYAFARFWCYDRIGGGFRPKRKRGNDPIGDDDAK